MWKRPFAQLAHGITGNRFSREPMFDDPAVADEFLMVPSAREHPSNVTTGCTILVVRSLVHPEIAIGIDSGIL